MIRTVVYLTIYLTLGGPGVPTIVDLQISMTSDGRNLELMKVGHVTQLFLDSSMNIKHNNCAVNIEQFKLKIDCQASGKFCCLCNHIKYLYKVLE